ncbi:MAG: hypothetical protein ACLTDR_15065 [Adlercreutzia equolifaciens]
MPYRERPGHEVANAEGKFVRQSGGRVGQRRPMRSSTCTAEPGAAMSSPANKTVGAWVPKEYIPSIDKGIQEALNWGVPGWLPRRDAKVELIDGLTTT